MPPDPKETRRKAWATRRATYGPKGHSPAAYACGDYSPTLPPAGESHSNFATSFPAVQAAFLLAVYRLHTLTTLLTQSPRQWSPERKWHTVPPPTNHDLATAVEAVSQSWLTYRDAQAARIRHPRP